MLFKRIQQNQCSLILLGRITAGVLIPVLGLVWFLIDNEWINSSLKIEPLVFLLDVPLIVWLEYLHRTRCSSEAQKLFEPIDLSNPRNQRIRSALLQNAQSQLVDDYLETTPQNIVQRLNLNKSTAQVELARNAKMGTPLREEREIPNEKPIFELFHESGNALLILGEPGAGKTFTLAELARDLIAKAEKDEMATIPLILSLNSWQQELDFVDWLAAELNLQYQLSRELAPNWIVSGHIALLLDGLDEVGEIEQKACVEAINAFCAAHKVDVAVCCRAEEYRLLKTKLNLSQAIRLLPLTENQIIQFLQEIGPNSSALIEAIKEDSSMMELAQTPLFLRIMALAYRDLPASELEPLQSVPARRKHLYDVYIQQQLGKLEEEEAGFSVKEAYYWLTWMARRMEDLEETEFYLERLQARWLPETKMRLYHAIKVGMTFGLAFALPYGTTVGLAFGLPYGLFGGLTWGFIAGLLGGTSVGLRFGREAYRSEVNMADELKWVWPSWVNILITLLFGCVVWLNFWLVASAKTPLIGGLVSTLILGLIYGLAVGLANGIASGLVSGIVGGVIVGLISDDPDKLRDIVGGVVGLISEDANKLIGGFIGGLFGGLAFTFIGGLSIGLRSNDIGIRTESGMGLRRSWHSALKSFVLNGAVSGLILALAVGAIGIVVKEGLMFGLIGAISFGTAGGLSLAVVAAIKDGGNAIINFRYLCQTLAFRNYIPSELNSFLITMTRINLLQRKGSGYRFLHITFRDHLARNNLK